VPSGIAEVFLLLVGKKFIDDNRVPLHLDYVGFQETKKGEF
jgi:hypothetical protein